MRRYLVVALIVVACGVGAGVLAGCGGGSNEDHDKSVAGQAAQQAIDQERARQAEGAQKDKLRKLQRKLRHERHQHHQPSNGGGGGGGGGGSGASGASGGSGKSCGGGVTANSATTCPFALNVADEYRSSGGASTIQVYSPVTKQTYTMSCTGSPTTCTGGNSASVTIS
ncbi:MAG TPA: hypothetical protein VM712_10685 [Gaiellales bacterium]|nr:hypothetical protein [Gaiellales bacterium]